MGLKTILSVNTGWHMIPVDFVCNQGLSIANGECSQSFMKTKYFSWQNENWNG